MQILEDAARRIRQRLPAAQPRVGLILGSGWSPVTAGLTVRQGIDYAEIPGLGRPSVAGHGGRLLWVEHPQGECLVFEGRRHWYEGVGWEPVALPVFALKACAVPVVLLTNSVGGIARDLAPGDLMVIDDHLNAMGVNPLAGPPDAAWGERFPDMSAVYDPALRGLLDEVAHRAGLRLVHGTYVAVSGPSYETPAEVAAFQTLGADAVGMSTVPEAILAHAAGLRVAGVCLISNRAAGSGPALAHADVLAAAAAAAARMQALVRGFLDAVLHGAEPGAGGRGAGS
jgi:purine-nucleoside phosphorylase